MLKCELIFLFNFTYICQETLLMCNCIFLHFPIHHCAKYCYGSIRACHLLSTLLLCPNKLFSLMTDNDPSAENNCEEQQHNEAEPQTQVKQLASDSKAKSRDKQLHPEDPDLPDRSSQSSFASVDGTGKYTH